MKKDKVITIVAIMLAIITIVIVSIFGLYKKKDYQVVNIIPKYKFGMDFSQSVIANLVVNENSEEKIYDAEGKLIEEKEEGIEYTEENGYTITQEKANDDSILTEENYEKAKDILLNRLIATGASQYNIRQDKSTGRIGIEIPNDNSVETILGILSQKGKFTIIDDETKEVLLDNSHISTSTIAYQQLETGTSVYLQLLFNKEGTKKLEEISKIYVEYEEEDENGESVTSQKKVSIMLDDEAYKTTYFGDKVSDGLLNILVGTAAKQDDLQQYVREASSIGIVLTTGEMPIDYTVSYENLLSDINKGNIRIFMYVAIVVSIALIALLIYKFKIKGIYATILQIGYVCLLLLMIRLVDVKLTVEGIVGIILAVLLNYAFMYIILNNIYKGNMNIKEAMLNGLIKFSLKLVPIYIISIIFVFASELNINSLGMTVFWGSITMYIYNFLFSKTLLDVIGRGE